MLTVVISVSQDFMVCFTIAKGSQLRANIISTNLKD